MIQSVKSIHRLNRGIAGTTPATEASGPGLTKPPADPVQFRWRADAETLRDGQKIKTANVQFVGGSVHHKKPQGARSLAKTSLGGKIIWTTIVHCCSTLRLRFAAWVCYYSSVRVSSERRMLLPRGSDGSGRDWIAARVVTVAKTPFLYGWNRWNVEISAARTARKGRFTAADETPF
jgi:hypothetical protein